MEILEKQINIKIESTLEEFHCDQSTQAYLELNKRTTRKKLQSLKLGQMFRTTTRRKFMEYIKEKVLKVNERY